MSNRWYRSGILACITTMGISSISHAVLIKGIVTDTLTKGPVDSVLVEINGSAGQAYTDENGKFTLNTTAVISGPAAARSIRRTLQSDISAVVYSANGTIIAKKDFMADPAILLENLPLGVYFVKIQRDGRTNEGKFLKVENRGRVLGNSAVSAFTVCGKIRAAPTALTFSHRYYTNKQVAVTDGDTNAIVQLRMWIPSPSTTGPTEPSALAAIDSRTITADGTVLENVLINGTITIHASGVTVRNFKTIVSDYFAFDITGTGVLLEDGEIDGGNTCDEAFRGSGYTARRLHIHNMEGDAFKANGENVIEDCYITDIGQGEGAHGDGVQMMGSADIRILHNNFDLTSGSLTACVFPGGGGYIAGVFVKGNRLNGGSYVIYCNEDMVVTNNVFGRDNGYGTHTDECGTWTWNVYEDNGELINP